MVGTALLLVLSLNSRYSHLQTFKKFDQNVSQPISGYGGCVPAGPSRSCQSLPSAGITPHHRYYELVRLPECRLYYLIVYRLYRSYSQWENTLGLPSSHNIHLIPCHGLRPRRARTTLPCPRAPCYIPRLEIRTIGDECAAFRQMKNVATGTTNISRLYPFTCAAAQYPIP